MAPPVGSALYYEVSADHRQTLISSLILLAAEALNDMFPSSPETKASEGMIRNTFRKI